MSKGLSFVGSITGTGDAWYGNFEIDGYYFNASNYSFYKVHTPNQSGRGLPSGRKIFKITGYIDHGRYILHAVKMFCQRLNDSGGFEFFGRVGQTLSANKIIIWYTNYLELHDLYSDEFLGEESERQRLITGLYGVIVGIEQEMKLKIYEPHYCEYGTIAVLEAEAGGPDSKNVILQFKQKDRVFFDFSLLQRNGTDDTPVKRFSHRVALPRPSEDYAHVTLFQPKETGDALFRQLLSVESQHDDISQAVSMRLCSEMLHLKPDIPGLDHVLSYRDGHYLFVLNGRQVGVPYSGQSVTDAVEQIRSGDYCVWGMLGINPGLIPVSGG